MAESHRAVKAGYFSQFFQRASGDTPPLLPSGLLDSFNKHLSLNGADATLKQIYSVSGS